MDGTDVHNMRAIELGRGLLNLGQETHAAEAFALAIGDASSTSEEILEAAVCLIQYDGDYHTAYGALLDLYRDSAVPAELRGDALSVLRTAFYLPNEDELRRRYKKNCTLLGKYPYLFRRDFPAFQDLPLRFYPYDDGIWYPFDGKQFLPRVQPGYEVISRNFFRDLEKPVLASDVYSQYELAYLRDNVRRSEDVGRENHVYLHYTDWSVFCAWMQVLDFRPLLREKKLVFLFGDELRRYPIDFQAEYGIDYSRFPVKPVSLREVTRLIWHTQLSSHNGGDFFNEIFDAHPNLICLPSVMLSDVQELVDNARMILRKADSPQAARYSFRHWENPGLAEELYRMKQPTDKDFLVALYLGQKEWNQFRDRNSRIAPALFFQPHFPNIIYILRLGEGVDAALTSKRMEEIRKSPLLHGFPYVKSFTPLRRWTTSFGGAMRFTLGLGQQKGLEKGICEPLPNAIIYRIMNRSFMADPDDRLFRDAVMVRLEDGKLYPRATLSRLAAFLDLPYTPSMAYCSEKGVRDPDVPEDPQYAVGFSLASLNRDYSMYVNDSEAAFLEYCFRDAYQYYGYDFRYYDGGPMDRDRMAALIDSFTTQDRLLREDWEELAEYTFSMKVGDETVEVCPDTPPEERERLWAVHMEEIRRTRQAVGQTMRLPLRYVSAAGQPLRMIPLLEPDPALLDGPAYR